MADTFDIYDLIAFHKFYNRGCSSIVTLKNVVSPVKLKPLHEEIEQLNSKFTEAEFELTLKRLQNNKSPSIDLISNEMLKCGQSQQKALILKLFNSCLQFGVYPWNCSMTTPLHKKRVRQNPGNYRAITLGSCLGKLFSSLLLQRLIELFIIPTSWDLGVEHSAVTTSSQ